MKSQKILCIDDDKNFLVSLSLQLKEHFRLIGVPTLEEGLAILEEKSVDIVLLDVGLGDSDGISAINSIKKCSPDIDIIMISGRRDAKTIVKAMRGGASDYMTKPLDRAEFIAVVERLTDARRMREKYDALIEDQNRPEVDQIVFKSDSIRRLLFQADQLKGHGANVLICGETGTGKELLARYIHRAEGVSGRPFVAVNCAAIPDNLIEAELFGSEPGAYTGALKRRLGKFELADGGDIFLDEIGALKLEMQAKILRVLQEKEFTRLGGNELIRADFRVIAATNELIEKKVAAGDFRMDLYHRIRVIQLSIPPLRMRSEDILELAEHFFRRFSRGPIPKKLSSGAKSRLMAYHWPGNVRELSNVIHGLTIVSEGDVIDEASFPHWAMNGCSSSLPDCPVPVPSVADAVGALREYVSRAERNYIERAIKLCGGDKSKTARVLGLGRTTLYAKMKELGLM